MPMEAILRRWFDLALGLLTSSTRQSFHRMDNPSCSAQSVQQSYKPNWFEKLLGIQVAEAHTIPSDWWSVPLTGGVVTQLTHIQAAGLFASISPDERYIVSYSANGLFVMNPDGTGLTMLIPDMGGTIGTVDWIP